MQRTYLFSLLILMSLFSYSQSPTYKLMMEDVRYNFYEVVDSAKVYFDSHGTEKGSGFKPFQRWINEEESKFYPSGDRLHAYYSGARHSFMVLKSEKDQKLGKNGSTEWQELGPWDANEVTRHYSPGIGRVETFWVNPANTREMMLGSRSGGFWRTKDDGKNWECTTDTLVASGVQSIAVDPFNNNHVLIATRQGGNGNTHGIYRSMDGGTTWTESQFNPSKSGLGGLGKNHRIYKIAFHPTRKGMIFIGTSSGLYVTKNNLNNWSRSFTGATTDIEFHPTDMRIIYAFKNSGTDRNFIKVSRDTGITFNNSSELLGNVNARCFIAVSPEQSKHVYVASTNGVWESSNEGLNFSFLSNPDESCQGFAVSDKNAKQMIYGYVDTEASSNGGTSFNQVTKWSVQDEAYVHADIRAAECLNGVFYLGTDGYLARSSDNGETWTKLNDGTAIREFYAVGLSQSNVLVHMAGSQDNGTSILAGDGWIEWNGGDGMEALIQPLNEEMMLGSWQYGARNLTVDGGQTRQVLGNPEKGSSKADWEAPLLMDPENHMRVYHLANAVYSSDDFGLNWELWSEPQIGIIKDAAISRQSSDVMVISRNSTIRITEDGGNNWANISNGLPGYSITDLAFDPRNDSTIILTYNRYQNDSRKVYISHDRGKTWSNITFNLKNMPLRTVTIDHTASRNIYVGGEIGVYYMKMGGNTWSLLGEELPNVTIKDLEVHYGSNTLKAASWGRGLWQHIIPEKENAPRIVYTSISQPPSESRPKKSVAQIVNCTIESIALLNSVEVFYSVNSTKLDSSIKMSNIGGMNWVSDMSLPTREVGDKIYFKIVAESANGQQTESFRYFYKVKPLIYCTAMGADGTGGDWIKWVNLGDISNTSSQDQYSDFSKLSTRLKRQAKYKIDVELNYHFDPDSVGAWIDFNNDRDFSEEETIRMSMIDNAHFSSGSFTVPVDAVMDDSLRLRVRVSYAESPKPCGIVAGEVEDYSILIDPADNTGLYPPENGFFKMYPNPTSGYLQILFDGVYKRASVSIRSIDGQLVSKHSVNNSNSLSFESGLAPGTYIVEVNTENKSSKQKLIIHGD